MKVHFVIHEGFEAPAAIEAWAQSRGHLLEYTRLHLGEACPAHCDADFLVVMGGPQSPATTLEECPHFDAAAEIKFIRSAIDQNKLLLGVCLGAQMIGEALDARFAHSPNREIGVFPLELTEEGRNDPFFAGFPERFPVGHWHGDMPGLTRDAQIFAKSEGCPRQIVRYSPRIYGFQCHFEFTPDAIEGMIQNSAVELEEFRGRPFVESAEQLRSHNYRPMNELLFLFLDRFSAAQL